MIGGTPTKRFGDSLRPLLDRAFGRWLWLCPLIMVAVGVGALMFFDLTFWRAFLVALLLVCPAIALGGVLFSRR